MIKMKRAASALVVFSVVLIAGQLPMHVTAQSLQQQYPPFTFNNISQIVHAMTVEEKAKIVVGMGFKLPAPPPGKDSIKLPAGLHLPAMDPEAAKIPEKVPGAAGRTHAISRLGIPSITMSDGPAGVRIPPVRNNDSSKTFYATAFPIGTLLASTWDTAMVRKVGAALGSEAHEYGIDIMLMPGMDIQRNPLNGRNFEYFSEDPLITGRMAAAMVKGVQSQGVGTSIKHFALNNEETNRNSINGIIDERSLREIYLRGFEIAVKESQPWTVMSSYNRINGIYASQDKNLLTRILRDEWGFKGLVMSDWFGGNDPVAQMKAGNDLLMPGTPVQSAAIINAVKDGSLPVQTLNRNVERTLELILKTPGWKHYAFSNKPDLKKDEQVSREAAAQGMVLLKNADNALPLKGAARVALFGYAGYDLLMGGYGSGSVNTSFKVSLNQGLIQAGFSLDKALETSYKSYISHEKAVLPKPAFVLDAPAVIPEMPVNSNTIKKAAGQNDVAIIVIGRNSGESRDRELSDLSLSQQESELFKKVSDAFHARGKKVVVVLNIAGPINIADWSDEADGILLAWMPGQEGGNAMADVLSGKVNPSGKLAQTLPVKYDDVPSAKSFPGVPQKNPVNAGYGEGIYVGYRYYNTFGVKTAYPFGYGLSYTHFDYSGLTLNSEQFVDKITATVTVKNSGQVAGKEVVELYLSAPQKELAKPSEELKAFAKTRLLQPGESQVLHFDLDLTSLASFDPPTRSWVAEKGKYEVKIGASSADIRQSAAFELAKDLTVEKVSR